MTIHYYSDETLRLMDVLLSKTDTLMDYANPDLYEHMVFNPMSASFEEMVINNRLKQFLEDDTYKFVKESAGWEDFKKKWSS